MTWAGSLCPPAPAACTTGQLLLPQGSQGQGWRGAGEARGTRLSVTPQLKLCVYEHLCGEVHFSLLNLPNKTGSNWNVKTIF